MSYNIRHIYISVDSLYEIKIKGNFRKVAQ